MYIVLVVVTIRPEMRTEFEQALLHNARESVANDEGCRRFDISQDVDDPARWILHEIYDAPESHAKHRQSTHFLAYDNVAQRAIIEKTVFRAVGRHVS
jgi:quinol monooxygenase YgiN